MALPCAIPESDSEPVGIGYLTTLGSVYNPYSDEIYLTHGGETPELDFRNECKNYTKFRKVFRQEVKTTHEKCEGVGDVCEYKGSAGCGIDPFVSAADGLSCKCEIEFTYCTQTSESLKLEEKIENRRLPEGHPLNR